ncbi:hypothetical protein ALI144C_04315 [Actinosynnema sp. ALI-1.44]|nr:hypothetical protein ALI144C_04315 [Actinosynnema sp. ALI-1.44]
MDGRLPGPLGRSLDQVMKIRRDLLGVGEARAEPDFFDLSGESLLFIRMVAGIRGHFGARSRRG